MLREPYNTSIASSYIQAWHLRDSATGWSEASTLLSNPFEIGPEFTSVQCALGSGWTIPVVSREVKNDY